MAKNWQYGRFRAAALQVVMWLVFGASLGLAAYIDHRKSAQLNVTLGEPRAIGRLVARLPKGWEVEEQTGTPLTLIAKDFDAQGRERRLLKVTQEVQTGRKRGAQYYLESVANLPDEEGIAPPVEPFAFLGQDDGVLMPFRINTRSLRMYIPDANLPDAGLYACAVLPDGLSVTVQITGDGAYGPSNRGLLRRVADSLKVTDAATTRNSGG